MTYAEELRQEGWKNGEVHSKQYMAQNIAK